MSDLLVIFAHPHYQHSRVNRAMVEAVQGMEGVRLHDLYELYPHFSIDAAEEQAALEQAHTIVFHHPFQWYGAPALLKEWMDLVLEKGWAYGEGGTALQGKRLLSAITTGGPEASYHAKGYNRFTMDQLLAPFDQTAHLCGMEYLEPFLFHDALRTDRTAIQRHADAYRDRIAALLEARTAKIYAHG